MLRKARPKITGVTQALLLRLLVDDPYTVPELCSEVGLGVACVRNYMRELRKKGLIYVVDQVPDKRGCRTIELWRWGPDKPDTYRKNSDSTKSAAYRARAKTKRLRAAIVNMARKDDDPAKGQTEDELDGAGADAALADR